jgi:hypothetical protein
MPSRSKIRLAWSGFGFLAQAQKWLHGNHSGIEGIGRQMKQIVFKVLTGAGKAKRLGTAKMKDGKVKMSFKEVRVQKNLELSRIVDISGQAFTPEDGVEYLLALPRAFYGSRLWAEVEDIARVSPLERNT